MSTRIFGPRDATTALDMTSVGLLQLRLHDYARAELQLRRAVAIAEQVLGPEHAETAHAIAGLGTLYVRTGAYSKALPLLERALATREKTSGAMAVETAKGLTDLGELHFATAAYDRAEPLFRRALRIREQALGPTHDLTIAAVNNLAVTYHSMGAYDRAEPLYQRALETTQDGTRPSYPTTVHALGNLAALYADTGAHAQAIPLHRRVLQLIEQTFGADHPESAAALTNLAIDYLEAGAYQQAQPLYERALAIRVESLGQGHPDTGIALNNLAELYRIQAAYAKAEPLYQRALAVSEQALGRDHPTTAQVLDSLGSLYQATGAYARSLPLYERAFTIRSRTLGMSHPQTATTLQRLGAVQWAMRDTPRALVLFQRALTIQASNASRFLLIGSETRKHAYLQALAEGTRIDVSFSVAVPSPGSAQLGLSSVLDYKGRVLDSMSDAVSRLRRSVNQQDRALFEQLSQVVNQISNLSYEDADAVSQPAQRQRLAELARQQQALETRIAARSQSFAQQVSPATITAVRNHLAADTTLIEWFRYEPFQPRMQRPTAKAPRYLAYLLGRSTGPVAVDLGDARVIDGLIDEFRRAAGNPERSDVRAKSAALSAKLIYPLSKHLRGSTRLLLSPDGALNLVPMAALLDEHGQYLASRFEITYLTSARDVLRIAEFPSREGPIVIADPDYGNAVSGTPRTIPVLQQQRSPDVDRGELWFKPLPDTKLEARALQGLLDLRDASVLMQLDATEERLKQVAGPLLLHVATHGFFLEDQGDATLAANPLLRSGLALTGANRRRSGAHNDGVLTALEASQLDLQGTQLVVLSACDTGVGEVRNGEGVYGLRRALVLAGAQSLVTTLWQVRDAETRILMTSYYDSLLRGAGRSAALRAAQLTALDSRERSHPYFWAGFIPSGNWRPLPGRSQR